MDGHEVGDEEFLDIAKDPARARALRKSLQRLAGSGDETVREMAREVLAGRVGLRQALRTGAYREALHERAEIGMRAYEQMSAEERSAAEAEGLRQLDEYQEEIDRERAERQREQGRGKRGGPAPHQSRGWQL
jgi:vacuolar-type H+-ATPase subunit I/STV1